MNNFMSYLAEKYHIKIAEREDKWLKEYPRLANRIISLEEEIQILKDEQYGKTTTAANKE